MGVKTYLLNRLDPVTQMRLKVFKHNITKGIRKTESFNGFLDEKNLSSIDDTFMVHEYRMSNGFYGIGNCLKQYAKYNKPICALIEHGVYFGEYYDPIEVSKILPALFTFGSVRREHIQNVSDIITICIGPYINYAKPFFNKEENDNLKGRYGKILLVFPQHTIEGIELKGNDKSFIDTINDIKETGHFDSVLISLYYRDVSLEAIKFYKSMGFIPICAGNRQDPLFLCRMKSFIELSDYTISDNVGTHVGYCYALGKDHYIFDSEMDIIATNENVKHNVPSLLYSSSVKEKNEVRDAFRKEGFSSEKELVVKKYWGRLEPISSQDMSKIMNFAYYLYHKKSTTEMINNIAHEYVESDASMNHLINEGIICIV